MIDNRSPIKAWSYHYKTSELVSELKAIPDPNDPDNYLVPAYCTTTEPPKKKKGYIAFWNGEKWEAKKVTA